MTWYVTVLLTALHLNAHEFSHRIPARVRMVSFNPHVRPYKYLTQLSSRTNPQSRYRLKKSERKALKEREKDRAWFNEPILEVDGRSHVTSGMQGPVGHDSNAPYATPPQNRYQQWLREKQGDEAGVNDHCTNRFSEHQVEATTMVPLKAGASHREIPMVLWPEHCKPGMKQEKKSKCCGRTIL